MGGAAAGISVSVSFLDPADKKSEYDSLKKPTCLFEQQLRRTGRLLQGILEIVGQESQHSMSQALPKGLSDSCQKPAMRTLG